jgi:hypothetical protein
MKLLQAGWRHDEETQEFQNIVMAEPFIIGENAEVFIYSSGNQRWE